MTDPSIYGFAPGKDGAENAKALQQAVDRGGTILITQPGIYDLSEPVLIRDDTTLLFGAGVTLRRQKSSSSETGYVFANKGAFTRTYNRNIKLIGLRLICNGVVCGTEAAGRVVPGLRGHISFFYVKNL